MIDDFACLCVNTLTTKDVYENVDGQVGGHRRVDIDIGEVFYVLRSGCNNNASYAQYRTSTLILSTFGAGWIWSSGGDFDRIIT